MIIIKSTFIKARLIYPIGYLLLEHLNEFSERAEMLDRPTVKTGPALNKVA